MTHNILDYYAIVHEDINVIQPFIPVEPETFTQGRMLVPNIHNLTLAQYDPITKNYITAHRLADYRRNVFSIHLLPKVEPFFDKILEGSRYWNEKLHNAGIN